MTTVRRYSSFAEADEAEKRYYRGLSPDERTAISRELMRRVFGDLSLVPDVREAERRG